MPTTNTELPILAQFLCVVHNRLLPSSSDMPQSQPQNESNLPASNGLPKGVVIGPDGKPCRSCTSVASWMAMTRKQKASGSDSSAHSRSHPSSATASTTTASTAALAALPSDCPPDVDALGRSTWTFLHTLTATYPERPSPTEQAQAKTFISLFSKMYPCGHCAEDFRGWMAELGNEPRVGDREEFGRWMCEAHNAVNVKLGKGKFDCSLWKERWRDGWKDGSCD